VRSSFIAACTRLAHCAVRSDTAFDEELAPAMMASEGGEDIGIDGRSAGGGAGGLWCSGETLLHGKLTPSGAPRCGGIALQ